MDKRIIFAVAGSGKTTNIINQLDLSKNSLIITFTNNNLQNLRLGIIKKFSFFPQNVLLLSYFTFLHSFCFKPFLSYQYKTRGINYLPNLNKFAKNDDRYIDKNKRLYGNRISKFLSEKDLYESINSRISKYFNTLYIDEVQDFAGHDFNFLLSILKSNLNILLVGDFYQHTFDTSRDGNVNSTLHDNYSNYQKRFINVGITVDLTKLNRSYRCSQTICNFISEKIGISISSHRQDETQIHIIANPNDANQIFENNGIVKLFYQEHYKYNCFSRNWGDSKGEDKYESVCVVLNKTSHEKFKNDCLHELPTQTKNKLYVACSRVRKDLYLVAEELIKHNKIN